MGFKKATKQAVRSEARDAVVARLEEALAGLLATVESVDGLTITGLSVNRNKQGGGMNSVLRLHVEAGAMFGDVPFEFAEGNYVVFGGGEDWLAAIADLEVQMVEETATLRVDEFAVDRTPKTVWSGLKGKNKGQ